MPKTTIAVAGATGFVGQALIPVLAQKYDVIALSRAPRQSDNPNVVYRSCNLFNLLHTERALAGADIAFYLVHSMSPSARLAQGNFADMDLICADNFARAARACGVRRILYLSGLTPKDNELSMHLRSRLEVEQTLGAHEVPCTTLRAGLIVGAGGSSFRMMTRLVQRLPLMVMPAWTRSLTQPVALDDVITLLQYCLDHPDPTAGQTYDIGCPTVLSYTDMLTRTAQLVRRHLPMVHVPLIAPKLSLLWVCLVTGSSPQLVIPLVQSLRHDMIALDGLRLQKLAGIQAEDFTEAMQRALQEEQRQAAALPSRRPRKPKLKGPQVNSVISVQRLHLPQGRNAEWVADAYARWLPQFLRPLLRVDVQAGRKYRFFVPLINFSLLELTFAPHRSTPDRQLFYVTGGWLARLPQTEPGRFEFRTALDRQVCISAVHDFVPQLPWYIYKATQAIVHGWVMWAFGRYLKRQKPVSARSLDGTSAEALEKTRSTEAQR